MMPRSMLAQGLLLALSLGAPPPRRATPVAAAASKQVRSPDDISTRQAKRAAKLARRAARAGHKAPTA